MVSYIIHGRDIEHDASILALSYDTQYLGHFNYSK